MKKFLIPLFCIVLLMSCISAEDFRFQNSTADDLFIFNQTGDLWINGAFFGSFATIDSNIASNVTELETSMANNVSALETRIGNVNTTGNIQELINSTGVYSTYNETYHYYAENGTTIAYQNITNLPTCTGSQVLTFDGSTLSCTDTTFDNTNVAYFNNTNTFSPLQLFEGGMNVTGNITLMTDDSYVKGVDDTVGMRINSTGSIIFTI